MTELLTIRPAVSADLRFVGATWSNRERAPRWWRGTAAEWRQRCYALASITLDGTRVLCSAAYPSAIIGYSVWFGGLMMMYYVRANALSTVPTEWLERLSKDNE